MQVEEGLSPERQDWSENNSEIGETDEDIDVDTVDEASPFKSLSEGLLVDNLRKSDRKRKWKDFGSEYVTPLYDEPPGISNSSKLPFALSARRKRNKLSCTVGTTVDEEEKAKKEGKGNTNGVIKPLGPVSSFDSISCKVCQSKENEGEMLLCDGCDKGFHLWCLVPKRKTIPKEDWYCKVCKKENNRIWNEQYAKSRVKTKITSPIASKLKSKNKKTTLETNSLSKDDHQQQQTNKNSTQGIPNGELPQHSTEDTLTPKYEEHQEVILEKQHEEEKAVIGEEIVTPFKTNILELLKENEEASRECATGFALQRTQLFEQFANEVMEQNIALQHKVFALEKEKMELSRMHLDFQKAKTQLLQDKLKLMKENTQLMSQLKDKSKKQM